MKRLLAKIGRFFGSRGFLKFCLWTITLIILFYAEENWRGARMWASTKAKWEAQGVSFDPQSYVPPPIPDDQNLGAIPLFKLEPDPEMQGSIQPVTLNHALGKNRAIGENLSKLWTSPDGRSEQAPDPEELQKAVAQDYGLVFKKPAPTQDMLVQYDALYPFVSQLTAISELRRACRFQHEYIDPVPGVRSLGLIVAMIRVAKLLTYHAAIALETGRHDVALRDITTNAKLASALQHDPSLVAGMVAIGMMAIDYPALRQGLAQHAWNDAQLASLQETLSRIDFLKGYQTAMQGEPVTRIMPILDTIRERQRWASYRDFFAVGRVVYPKAFFGTYLIMPTGWLDVIKSSTVDACLSSAQTVSPSLHRVSPGIEDELVTRASAVASRWDGDAAWNYLFSHLVPPIIKGTSRFAVAQVSLDQAEIACGLERYRLAHGAYPETLESLAPNFISDLPHDIANGKPYQYRLRSDGSFLLYSVGWNQRDDGGKVVYDKDEPRRIDYNQGDWVWPTMKVAESAP